MDQRLAAFINTARQQGQADEEIQIRLKNAGGTDKVIAEAFGATAWHARAKPQLRGIRVLKMGGLLLGGAAILVVVVLVALSPIALISYNAAHVRARDVRRMTDLATLRSGINSYFAAHGEYPEGRGFVSEGMLNVLSDENRVEYIPTDPGDYAYFYCTDPDRQRYVLGVTLEQEQLGVLKRDLDGDQYCGTETRACDDPTLCIGTEP